MDFKGQQPLAGGSMSVATAIFLAVIGVLLLLGALGSRRLDP
jgi:hypothetical protein